MFLTQEGTITRAAVRDDLRPPHTRVLEGRAGLCGQDLHPLPCPFALVQFTTSSPSSASASTLRLPNYANPHHATYLPMIDPFKNQITASYSSNRTIPQSLSQTPTSIIPPIIQENTLLLPSPNGTFSNKVKSSSPDPNIVHLFFSLAKFPQLLFLSTTPSSPLIQTPLPHLPTLQPSPSSNNHDSQPWPPRPLPSASTLTATAT